MARGRIAAGKHLADPPPCNFAVEGFGAGADFLGDGFPIAFLREMPPVGQPSIKPFCYGLQRQDFGAQPRIANFTREVCGPCLGEVLITEK